jgi:hypothetical protein
MKTMQKAVPIALDYLIGFSQLVTLRKPPVIIDFR